MSTDRELLVLAAKAAGWVMTPHRNRKSSPHLIFTYGGSNWNPLTDDGDALRLAVCLGLGMDTERGATSIFSNFATVVEDHLPDPYVATRRAIVLAAAEIGRAKP